MKAASLKPEVALLDSKYIHIQYKKNQWNQLVDWLTIV
jgi:hypothetical protein